MGYSKLSITIPEELHSSIKKILKEKKFKLSHFVTEALNDKMVRIKEEAYIQQVNKAFEDQQISREQQSMAESIAESMNIEELPW